MELILLSYKSKEVRMITKMGDPFWVAKDVCEALGIKSHRSAFQRLNEDEKGVESIDSLGGKQNFVVVNEAGLYSLILCSKKGEAMEFKRWLTHEVLPSIRKTGAYFVTQTTNNPVAVKEEDDPFVSQVEMLLAVVKRQRAIEQKAEQAKADADQAKQIAQEALNATSKDIGYVSILGYARNHDIRLSPGQASTIGKALSKYCKDNNIRYESVSDAKWGKVNVYPHSVLDRHASLFLNRVPTQV